MMEIKYLTLSSNFEHKIAYTQFGDENNENILICVHGLTRNARDFDYLAQSLCDKYRVLCFDMPGRGESDWLEDPELYNYFTYVTDICSALSELNITKVDWVGTSMGGIIGMLIAAQFPTIINKMVINDVGPFLPASALKRIIEYSSQNNSFDSQEQAEEELRLRLKTFGIEQEEHWQHFFKHSIKNQDNGNYTLNYDPTIIQQLANQEIEDVDLWQIWEKITCPIYIIRGQESDILTSETAKKMTEKTNVQLTELKEIGHAPTLMDKEQISIIENWL